MQLKPARALSAAQTAVLRVAQLHARGNFLIANLLLLLLVFYTSHRFPHKFVRVRGEYVALPLFA